MAQADKVVTQAHTNVIEIIRHVEAAKALAASTVAQTTALGGAAAAVEDYVWPGGVTEADFINAMNTLANHVPTFLSAGHDSNMHKFATGLG